MGKIIYVVTQGCYSDYGICAVFDNRELAQSYIDALDEGFEGMDIEEWNLNPYELDLTKGRKSFFVRMTKEGKAYDIQTPTSSYNLESGDYNVGFCMEGDMHMSLFADDEKHAIKIVNEHRVQLIANNQWPEKQKRRLP